MCVRRITGSKFGAGFREGAARVVLKMPFRRHHIAPKCVERLLVIDQALVKETWVPIVENIADVEYDGGYAHSVVQLWRALNRRLGLLLISVRRSEERRGGKGCFRTLTSRRSPYYSKKK